MAPQHLSYAESQRRVLLYLHTSQPRAVACGGLSFPGVRGGGSSSSRCEPSAAPAAAGGRTLLTIKGIPAVPTASALYLLIP